MKQNLIKSLLWTGLLAASFSSCDLDVVPPDSMAAENFWQTEKDATYALNEIYARMPDFIDGMSYEMYTDNAHSHKPWEGAWEAFQQGGITAGQSSGYDYGVIRLVNDFLEKSDQCAMDDALRERMKAEARFFRAWAYQEMIVKFGGVPLVTTLLAYDAPNVKRDDIETVRTFILQELDEVADILPDSYEGGDMQETGRVSRAAALALRARVALYAGNYAEAEASATTVINEGHHSLFKVTALTAAQQQEADEMDQWVDFDALGIDREAFARGMFSYEGIWQDDNGAVRNNPEVLLSHEHMNDANATDWARYQYIRPSQLVRGYSSYEPLPELVQAYWNIDGQTLPAKVNPDTDAANYAALYQQVQDAVDQQSYIAKVPTLDLKSDAYIQQFRNRDSRLYASILLPFKGWHVTDFGTFYYRWNPDNAGIDGNESWTGFSWRKLVALRDRLQKQADTLQSDNNTLRQRVEEYEKKEREANHSRAVALVDEAVKDGRLDASGRDAWLKDFDRDFENTSVRLSSIAHRQEIVSQLESTGGQKGAVELRDMSMADILKADRLKELKADPELYKMKFREAYGHDPN